MTTPSLSIPESDQTDGFDRLPDPLILLIFNDVSDIKTLIRCRAVSKRFNSLVPQADSLLLRVDRVISATEPDDDDSFVVGFLRSIFKSLHDLVSPKPLPTQKIRTQNSPTRILRGFDRIRELEIELPSGDLRLEKGAVIRWRAEFGRTLRSCVILGFRTVGAGGREVDLGGAGGGLKMRVVWTISALIAASARHYMVRDVVREHGGAGRLVVRDREGEGTIVMDKDGLKECRESGEEGREEEEDEAPVRGSDGVWWRNNRTTVPAVRMRMRHELVLELESGVRMEGATLVVVRPTGCASGTEAEQQSADAALAYGAFGGMYGEAVEKLVKSRSYLLEMNSF